MVLYICVCYAIVRIRLSALLLMGNGIFPVFSYFSDVLKILVHVLILLLDTYLEVKLLGQFSKVFVTVYISTSVYESPLCSISLLTLGIFSVFNCTYFGVQFSICSLMAIFKFLFKKLFFTPEC